MTGGSDAEVAIRAALAAGEVIRRSYGAALDRFGKGDGDFATEADLAAERAVREILRAERPGDTILGEEYGTTGGDGPRTWLVDPLCGTLNFAARTPLVAVNVALRDGDRVTAAVSADPLSGEIFWTDGTNAFLRHDTAPADRRDDPSNQHDGSERRDSGAFGRRGNTAPGQHTTSRTNQRDSDTVEQRANGRGDRRDSGEVGGRALGQGDQRLVPWFGDRLVELNLDPPFPNGTSFRAAALLLDDAFAGRFRPRVVSSTVALAWVAAGRRAGYVTDGLLLDSVHFTSGIALCQAAGCVVTNLAGGDVHTGVEGLVVASDGGIHRELIDLVSRSWR